MAAKSPTKRKPKAKPKSDPAQYKRFLEAAKASEASDDAKAFDKALKRVAKR